jgi:WD40 repeat protein
VGKVVSMTFTSDSRMLATGSEDGTLKLWSTDTGRELADLSDSSGKITSLAFSPDDRTLASGNRRGTVELWEVPVGK